jgi:hypothetical protein
MRHPGDGRGLVQRVPLNVFTRGTRQDLYRLIALPIVAGKPVDWLITAWQATASYDGTSVAGLAALADLPNPSWVTATSYP